MNESGPVNFARNMQAVEKLLAAPPTFAGLEQMFSPATVPDRFDPGDRIKKMLAGLYATKDGRDVVHWLLDLTTFAPYPHVGPSFETAALAAKAHEARAAVGLCIMTAIAQGQDLFNKKEPN